jgi:RNA polymerase sigma-70 factor, ECF subfamily
MPGRALLFGVGTGGVGDRGDFEHHLRAAQCGDEEGFVHIWRLCQAPLLRYLKVMAGPLAEDLASDTWLQVARTLPSFEGDEPAFRGWLFTIARHRHIDICRRNARRREQLVEMDVLLTHPAKDDPQATVEERISTDDALALIATLPHDQAEIVTLRVIAGLDVNSVAEMVGRPPGTVRVLAHRGLRKLADLLEPVRTPVVPVTTPAAPEGSDLVCNT